MSTGGSGNGYNRHVIGLYAVVDTVDLINCLKSCPLRETQLILSKILNFDTFVGNFEST